MTGISKSKRIILWDTIIDKLDRDEILSITAHEIGHYVNGHIWKSIILGGLFSIFLLYLIYRTTNWMLIQSRVNFGFKILHDMASIPLIILVVNFYMFFASHIININSRYMERQADAYEIHLTQDKEATISSMRKLYQENLGIPRPSNIYKIWYGTHPTSEERIKFFKEYEF